MEDDDSPLEDDEEEYLVYVDFEGNTGNNTFSSENLQLNMLGFDMECPVIQVNGKYYEGTYEDAVGTYMFFDKNNNPQVDDHIFDNIPTLKYYEKTRKVLKMKRIFVKPRLEVLGDSDDAKCIPNIETIKEVGVPLKYQEEALNLWKEMRNERLEALNEYLKKQKQREEKRQQGIELESESDEDNPFAMYRLQTNDSDDIPTDELQINVDKNKDCKINLTVIDPGPSTSKDSEPWNEPSSDNENNSGFIDVVPQKRPDRRKKFIKKEIIDDSYCDNETNFEYQSDYLTNQQVEMNENDNVDENLRERMNEIDLQDELAPAVKVKVEMNDEIFYDKKLEKQKKREAKMKEISERLKKISQ